METKEEIHFKKLLKNRNESIRQFNIAHEYFKMYRVNVNKVKISVNNTKEEIERLKKKLEDLKLEEKIARKNLGKQTIVYMQTRYKKCMAVEKYDTEKEHKRKQLEIQQFKTNEQKIRRKNYQHARKKIDLKRLYEKITADEILDHIYSYVGYDVRIQMLEKTYRPMFYLNRLGSDSIASLLYNICRSPSYFTMLSSEEAQRQIYSIGQENNYAPDWHMTSRKQGIVKIKYFVNMLKQKSPKYVYNLFKVLSILKMVQSPNRTYKNANFDKTTLINT
jgi:hypothetical protein